ncbi:MAG: 2Fe-2S iron-sulfur cluster binding domain-containing protein [Oscillatoriales cyanobacterium SM2_2_1]|nr:2Fe-2S iron-sulfur cluster binding domain-containing protein [Oscillatoriales cyanobacterium SM2_2_1]
MAQTHQVTIHHQGEVKTIVVPEDQTILEAAQAQGLDLPCSCLAGICTSCAAQLVAGTVDQSEGMGDDVASLGYALLCVTYPRSDVEVISSKEEEVYRIRFGSGA